MLTQDTATDTPRIYVASLSDYNQGRLHGAWIDADQDADELWAAIHTMLAASPEPNAEEWAIHDYEGFGGLRLSESEAIEDVAALGHCIAEHGSAFAAHAGNVGLEYATVETFEESYAGEWDSERAFADDLADQIDLIPNDVPELLQRYFDWDAWARDLFLGDYTSDPAGPGRVYVFRNV